MKIWTTISLAFAILLAVAGCASSDANAPAEGASGQGSSAAPGASAELAKCGGCGKEVAKAELVAHDGMMLCKECMQGHNH
jgi:hypothetical protein